MAEIIRFPQERCDYFKGVDYNRSAIVLVLPVIRIEREGGDDPPGRRRRADRVSMADLPEYDPALPIDLIFGRDI